MSNQNTNESLTAPIRFQYLKAMGVTPWVLRGADDHRSQADVVVNSSDVIPAPRANSALSQSNEAFKQQRQQGNSLYSENASNAKAQIAELQTRFQTTSKNQPNQNGVRDDTPEQRADDVHALSDSLQVKNARDDHMSSYNAKANSERVKALNDEPEALVPIEQNDGVQDAVIGSAVPKVATTQQSAKAIQSPSGFVVPCGKPHQGQRVRLGILCRHGVDQPYQSYFSKGRPSKTMSNIIMALDQLSPQIENEQCVNLFGQLGSTPLSDHAINSSDWLTRSAPEVLLLLGEATANQFFGEKKSLAEWRLKQWHVIERSKDLEIPVIVSYHPYQIFKSPLLKRDVYADMLRLVPFLSHE